MITWTATPQSSNVKRVGFDDETQDVIVEFANGNSYSYSGAGEAVAADLASNPSPGGFFSRHIRNKYPAKKL